jgi:hypothetical protein
MGNGHIYSDIISIEMITKAKICFQIVIGALIKLWRYFWERHSSSIPKIDLYETCTQPSYSAVFTAKSSKMRLTIWLNLLLRFSTLLIITHTFTADKHTSHWVLKNRKWKRRKELALSPELYAAKTNTLINKALSIVHINGSRESEDGIHMMRSIKSQLQKENTSFEHK